MNAPENHFTYNEKKDDEIDLRDIALAIHAGWKWIAISTAFCVLMGFIYAFLVSTPIYSTDISYSATPGGLNALNSMPEINYSEPQAFEEFSKNLSSYENFKSFLEENPDTLSSIKKENPDSQVRSLFFDRIDIITPGENEETRRISLQYTEEMDGPKILNEYFRWSEEAYAQTLADRATRTVGNAIDRNRSKMDAHLRSHQDDISARIERLQEEDEIKIAELEDRLQAEKQSVISLREERIRVLEHAEQIASRLGIEKPTTPRDLGRQPQDRDVIYAEINSQGGLPLYFMGVEALRAEREVIEQNLEEDVKTEEIREIESQLQQLSRNRTIEAITSREKQTPFIEEYNNLRSQNEILSASMISSGEIDIVSAINWAYHPEHPDSPRHSLIISLSLILGGMLGIMLVFISNFVSSLRGYKKPA